MVDGWDLGPDPRGPRSGACSAWDGSRGCRRGCPPSQGLLRGCSLPGLPVCLPHRLSRRLSLQPHSTERGTPQTWAGVSAAPTGLGCRGGQRAGLRLLALPLPALAPTARRPAAGPGSEPEKQGPSPPQPGRMPLGLSERHRQTGSCPPPASARPGPCWDTRLPCACTACPLLGNWADREDRSPLRARATVSGRHAWLSKGPKPFPA